MPWILQAGTGWEIKQSHGLLRILEHDSLCCWTGPGNGALIMQAFWTMPKQGSMKILEDAMGSSVQDGFGVRQHKWSCSVYEEEMQPETYN